MRDSRNDGLIENLIEKTVAAFDEDIVTLFSHLVLTSQPSSGFV
jgi:hypothetical protein